MHELYDGHSSVFYVGDSPYINDFSKLNEIGLPAKINGEPIEQLRKRFYEVFQYETESYADIVFAERIISKKGCLEWIGVDTSNGVTFTFDTDDGQLDCHYDFVPYDQVIGVKEEKDEPWVSYKISPDNTVGIFTLNTCDFNDEYKKTVKEFFEKVDETGAENIIVDLRKNSGGNSYVADYFLKYIDVNGYNTWSSARRVGNHLDTHDQEYIKNDHLEPKFSGNVYILTSTLTYSAAMDFTMYFMDNDLGKVVGEPSGNLPDSYGDCLSFSTPNSKLGFNVSYKKWQRIDTSKSGEPLTPDYPCDADKAMGKAFEIIKAN